MSRRRKPPYKAASAWLWIDTYLKLPVSMKIVALGLLALTGMIIAAYWWAILLVLFILAAWRYWLNAGTGPRNGPGNKIPYGKLNLIEWACCKGIGICEAVLARHNLRRKP